MQVEKKMVCGLEVLVGRGGYRVPIDVALNPCNARFFRASENVFNSVSRLYLLNG